MTRTMTATRTTTTTPRTSAPRSTVVRSAAVRTTQTPATPAVRCREPRGVTVEPARRASRKDVARPGVAPLDYGQRTIGVSQFEHPQRRGFGFVRACGVAVVTAGLALGLVGLANLRGEPAPVPAAVDSVQVDGAPAVE